MQEALRKLHKPRNSAKLGVTNMNAPVQTPLFVKAPGICAQLHALWTAKAAEQGVAILPRKDAVALGESLGFVSATCRTQFQVMFKKMKAASTVETPAPVETPTDAPAAEVNTDEQPAAEVEAPKLTKKQRAALKHATPAAV